MPLSLNADLLASSPLSQRLVLLDSDMLVLRNMDELMTIPLEEGWIAAGHACTCNPRKLAHYPPEW